MNSEVTYFAAWERLPRATSCQRKNPTAFPATKHQLTSALIEDCTVFSVFADLRL